MPVFSLYRFAPPAYPVAAVCTNSCLKLIDVILAWLVAEDDGAKQKIVSLLADRDEDLSLIRRTLQGKFQAPKGSIPSESRAN